jgi:hypothetical protein
LAPTGGPGEAGPSVVSGEGAVHRAKELLLLLLTCVAVHLCHRRLGIEAV